MEHTRPSCLAPTAVPSHLHKLLFNPTLPYALLSVTPAPSLPVYPEHVSTNPTLTLSVFDSPDTQQMDELDRHKWDTYTNFTAQQTKAWHYHTLSLPRPDMRALNLAPIALLHPPAKKCVTYEPNPLVQGCDPFLNSPHPDVRALNPAAIASSFTSPSS